jgi:hypothetical protein
MRSSRPDSRRGAALLRSIIAETLNFLLALFAPLWQTGTQAPLEILVPVTIPGTFPGYREPVPFVSAENVTKPKVVGLP